MLVLVWNFFVFQLCNDDVVLERPLRQLRSDLPPQDAVMYDDCISCFFYFFHAHLLRVQYAVFAQIVSSKQW